VQRPRREEKKNHSLTSCRWLRSTAGTGEKKKGGGGQCPQSVMGGGKRRERKRTGCDLSLGIVLLIGKGEEERRGQLVEERKKEEMGETVCSAFVPIMMTTMDSFRGPSPEGGGKKKKRGKKKEKRKKEKLFSGGKGRRRGRATAMPLRS